MSTRLDFCPTCFRWISDHDSNGREAESGQRSCISHRVRFVRSCSTGVMELGGPDAPVGFETDIEEHVAAYEGKVESVLVRFPEDVDGFAPRQYVPRSYVEVAS